MSVNFAQNANDLEEIEQRLALVEQQPGRIDLAVLRSYGLSCDGSRDVECGDGKILQKINWFNPEIGPFAPGRVGCSASGLRV